MPPYALTAMPCGHIVRKALVGPPDPQQLRRHGAEAGGKTGLEGDGALVGRFRQVSAISFLRMFTHNPAKLGLAGLGASGRQFHDNGSANRCRRRNAATLPRKSFPVIWRKHKVTDRWGEFWKACASWISGAISQARIARHCWPNLAPM